MLITILIYLGVIVLSVLSSVMPHTNLIPTWIIESIGTLGAWIAEMDAFCPGIIACLMNIFYIIMATQVAILSVIAVKKIINFLRGTGPI